MKILLPETYVWTRKKWLNFGSHPHLDPHLGIVRGRGIRQHCWIGRLSTLWLNLWKNWIWLDVDDVSLDKEILIKFWKSSWSGLLIWTGAALAEVYTLENAVVGNCFFTIRIYISSVAWEFICFFGQGHLLLLNCVNEVIFDTSFVWAEPGRVHSVVHHKLQLGLWYYNITWSVNKRLLCILLYVDECKHWQLLNEGRKGKCSDLTCSSKAD